MAAVIEVVEWWTGGGDGGGSVGGCSGGIGGAFLQPNSIFFSFVLGSIIFSVKKSIFLHFQPLFAS